MINWQQIANFHYTLQMSLQHVAKVGNPNLSNNLKQVTDLKKESVKFNNILILFNSSSSAVVKA